MIELVTNPEDVANGDEAQFKKHWTPAFVSYQKTREAMSLAAKMEKDGNEPSKIIDLLDEVENFIVELYGEKFTLEELRNGLHGPDAFPVLIAQIHFISDGQQTDDTKKFLQEKNS